MILKSVGDTVPPNSSTLRTTTFQRNAVFRPLSGKVFEMSIREMGTICWSSWATSKVVEYRHDFKDHAVLGRGWKYQIPSIPMILCVSMSIALQSPPETETTSTPVAAHVNYSQRTKPPSQKFGELTWWPEDGIIYKNHYWSHSALYTPRSSLCTPHATRGRRQGAAALYYIISADPGLRQGRGGAWDHRRCGTSPSSLSTVKPILQPSSHINSFCQTLKKRTTLKTLTSHVASGGCWLEDEACQFKGLERLEGLAAG